MRWLSSRLPLASFSPRRMSGHSARRQSFRPSSFRSWRSWSLRRSILRARWSDTRVRRDSTKQFFPSSDRPDVLIQVQMPYGTSIRQTSATTAKVEAWLEKQKEAQIVTAYVGAGAPRFFLSLSPELPDPSFAKIVILTRDPHAREALKLRLRNAVADGLAPEAQVRATQLSFGPPSPYPVAYRVSGPDPERLRKIASDVETVMNASPMMRTVNSSHAEVP